MSFVHQAEHEDTLRRSSKPIGAATTRWTDLHLRSTSEKRQAVASDVRHRDSQKGRCRDSTDAWRLVVQRSPRASQESGSLSPSSQRFLEHEVSTAWGVNSVNAREPSLSQLVVIAHDSRLIILLFISHSLRASRIPSKRGNPHADTRSGIDASWLACRGADYAPRLRFSPRMAQ